MKPRRLGWSGAALACVFAAGCMGSLGGPEDDDLPASPPPEPGDFECIPGDPSATVLQRMSRTQYLSALHHFVSSALGSAAEADEVVSSLESTVALLPLDGSSDHARLDQAVLQAHVDAQYHLAVGTADALLATPTRRESVVGACAWDTDPGNDESCLDQFIRRIGYTAHRRPLSEEEISFYRNDVYPPANGMDPAALRDVVAAMLLSPNFLYRLEVQGDPIDGRDDLYTLSPHEVAVRLAFHFWDGPPDDALYAAADSGELLTEDGYANQIDRMLDDPRTHDTFDRYYAEWLRLDDLAPLHVQLGVPAYDAMVGEDTPTPELRERLIEDLLDLTRYLSWQSEGDFASLFTADYNVAKTPDVAAIYGGVPLWQEGTEPGSLPDGTRAGILTRPAMLATGSVLTHSVLRGREVRQRILCTEIHDPPADAMDNPPVLDPIMTGRERMEAITEQPGSSCIGCHMFMNPIGYNLEGFDGLGRVRTDEVLYNDDGSILATLPLDTTAAPYLGPGDDTVVNDGVELSHELAQNNSARACFARHYFRFAFARMENDDVDSCELENIRVALEDGQSLRDVFRNIAMSPTFRQRKTAD